MKIYIPFIRVFMGRFLPPQDKSHGLITQKGKTNEKKKSEKRKKINYRASHH